MRPYYQDASVKIYHADCRELLAIMKPGSVDLVLTDPPFYLPAQISSVRSQWPRGLGNLGVMSSYFGDSFGALVRLLRPTGAFYSFADSTSYAVFLSVAYPLFARTQCVVWDKGVGGLGRGWRHSHDLILHGALASTQYDDSFRRDVLCHPSVPSAQRHHPSEKPIALLAEIIQAHPPGAILDPFMGSGSTLCAAKVLGRKAVGMEIEERYCEVAARRMEQSTLEGR